MNMNLLVVGCGKVGARLATQMSAEGHDVSVVDSDEKAFLQLGEEFTGMTFVGIEFDQDVLKRAGISACDALAAIGPDDNKNIMVSQIAKRIFNVPKVITRIYDPEREDVFSHLNLHTVCPTNLTVEAVKADLLRSEKEHQNLHFGMSTLSVHTEDPDVIYLGQTLEELAALLATKQSLLMGVLHAAGDVTLTVEDPNRVLLEDDKLIITRKVD